MMFIHGGQPSSRERAVAGGPAGARAVAGGPAGARAVAGGPGVAGVLLDLDTDVG